MTTEKPNTTEPLTEQHLRAAAAWALTAAEEAQPLDGAVRKYQQRTWDCGTACCLHGAAHLIARAASTNHGPVPEDYADLDPHRRAAVLGILRSLTGTPEELVAVLDGQHGIHPRAEVGAGAVVGARAVVGADAVVGARAVVEEGEMI